MKKALLLDASPVWFNQIEAMRFRMEAVRFGHKKTDLAGSVSCASNLGFDWKFQAEKSQGRLG